MDIGGIQKPELPGLDADTDSQLAGAKRAADRGDTQETARQFETLFGVMLVRELRRSMPKGLFGDGAGADVYEGWFDQQLGGALAERDAIGIAGMVKASIGRSQAALETAPKDGTAIAPASPPQEPKAAQEEPVPAASVHSTPLPLTHPLPLPPAPQALPLPLAPARPRPLPLGSVQKVPVRPTTAAGAKESGS